MVRGLEVEGRQVLVRSSLAGLRQLSIVIAGFDVYYISVLILVDRFLIRDGHLVGMEPLVILVIRVAGLHGGEHVRAEHVHLWLVVAKAGDEEPGELVLLFL